jgi:hypothetical protein
LKEKIQSGILSGAEAAKKSINYRSSSSRPKENIKEKFNLKKTKSFDQNQSIILASTTM